MVTSIRLLGGATGLAVPLAAAIALFWAGGTRPGLVGFLFTIALFGIPLGALSGAAFAPQAITTTRPILLAAQATFMAVLVGVIAYSVILVVTDADDGTSGAGSAPESVLASVIFLAWVVLGAWAFAMPYALLSVMLLRRLGSSGISKKTFASTAVVLLVGVIISGIDGLSSSGA